MMDLGILNPITAVFVPDSSDPTQVFWCFCNNTQAPSQSASHTDFKKKSRLSISRKARHLLAGLWLVTTETICSLSLKMSDELVAYLRMKWLNCWLIRACSESGNNEGITLCLVDRPSFVNTLFLFQLDTFLFSLHIYNFLLTIFSTCFGPAGPSWRHNTALREVVWKRWVFRYRVLLLYYVDSYNNTMYWLCS